MQYGAWPRLPQWFNNPDPLLLPHRGFRLPCVNPWGPLCYWVVVKMVSPIVQLLKCAYRSPTGNHGWATRW